MSALVLAVGALRSAPPVGATPAAAVGSFAFQGAGDGHGIGMSQWGARGYAVNGWSAEDILRHYYTGAATTPYAAGPLRVWLADTAPSTSFVTSGPMQVTSDTDPGAVTVDSAAGTLTVTAAGGRLSLLQGGRILIGTVAGPLAVGVGSASASTCTTAGAALPGTPCVRLAATGNSYGFGTLEFSATAGGIRIVERDLGVQQYLYGLAEVPSSWPAEALKAQVVAARSYALQKQRASGDRRSDCSCSVRATTADQAFAGLSKLAEGAYGPLWRNAVDVTNGVVVSADGATPLQAFYSASSGGRTESNEDGFGGTPISYLRSVDDPGDVVAGNPWASWNRTFGVADLQRYLDADSRTAVGTMLGLEVNGPFTAGGRPERITVIGSSRRVAVSATTFVSVVGAGAPSSQAFPSTLFTLGREPFRRYTSTGGVFVAAGADAVSPLTVLGSGPGTASQVRVVRADGTPVSSFSPYGTFGGGVRVAYCIDPSGTPLILTAPGPGGSSDIRLYSLAGNLIRSFVAFAGFFGGAFVACGNAGPAGEPRLVVGADAGGGPAVRAYDFTGALAASFYAYDASFGGGVRVAVGAVLGVGRAQIVTGTGPGGDNVVEIIDAAGTALQRVVPGGRLTSGTVGDGVYVAVLSEAPAGAVIMGSQENPSVGQVRVQRLDGTLLLAQDVFPGPVWGGGARVSWSPELGVVAGTGGSSWPDFRLVP